MNARILAGSLLAALLSLTVDVSAQHPDPAALRDRLQQAIGQGDVAAAVALFADDAIIETPVVCATTPCIGKAAIQKEIERRVANKQQPRTLKHYVSGDLLTTRVELASEAARKAGVDRIIFWLIYETKDGKIVSERGVLYERTDPQTARYIEWLRSQSPAR